MKSLEDAEALCEKEQDPFYLDAFLIEAWLGHVVLEAATEYAEKKNAKDRCLQSGGAGRGFMEIFGQARDEDFHHVFESLLRFTEYDDVQAHMLRRAIIPLSFEHESSGDFIGPKTLEVVRKRSEAIELIRRSVGRWCEWMDAVVHFETHMMWHLAPANFNPDPEKRELAMLGLNQRLYAGLSDFGKGWWQWHHGEAAERFKDSPKWPTVGEGMIGQEVRRWAYPKLDEVVIILWPLLKRHNWTYRDLMNVVRSAADLPDDYPCQREQDLSAYCPNVLGLRKDGTGRTATNGRPVGYDVAARICGNPSAGSS